MRFDFFQRALIVLSIVCGGSAWAQNDNCATPVAISGTGTFAFNNTSASAGTQGFPTPGCVTVGRDLWFRWTAPATGTATFQTCGLLSFDSAIAVFAGSVCPTAVAIACDDDACGLESLLSWNAVMGTTYMLEVGSSGGGPGGPGSFRLTLALPPSNDSCTTPVSIAGAGTWTYDNSLATTGAQGQGHAGCTDVRKDIWYAWTAPQNGTATLDTCFQTSDDTVVSIYAGSACPTSAPFACDDNFCGITSQVTWGIVSGAVYLIELGSAPGFGGAAGSFNIVVQSGGSAGIPYCFGDGTGAACPCGNNGTAGHGCASSTVAAGALIAKTGNASVMNDTLVLQGTSMPATASALYFQGTVRAGNGLGTVFGDGLRCATGAVLRLGSKTNVSGSSSYGGGSDVKISLRGVIPSGGGTRFYQVWYRNSATFCTSATFNLSHGLEIVWAP